MSPPPLKLFVTVYNDARLLRHFVQHYRAIGVTQLFLAVGADLQGAVEASTAGDPVTVVTGLDVADSVAGTAAISALRSEHQGEDEWAVIVDLDEFVECRALSEIITVADRAGANVVRGTMHDRFAVDGLLKDIAPESDLADVFPVKARFVRNVMKACDVKGVLVKGRLQPGSSAGHHWFKQERAFRDVLEISHYKWTAGALERLRHSLGIVQKSGVSWAVEYQRILAHVEAHGRFAWEEFGGQLSSAFVPEPPAGHCATCDGALTEAEVAYSVRTFGKPLCRAHQPSRIPVGV